MNHRYLPMTEKDRREMMKKVGIESIDELFADVPESVRFKGSLDLENPLSEPELKKQFSNWAKKNVNLKEVPSFLGAGVYDHYIPSVVDHVISRSEFYTAYTPYQAEISQGELQAIFEFQTMITELTGMDVANSSMYDGGTALAEAALLSAGVTKKKKIVLSRAVHPHAFEVVQTYARGPGLEVIEVPVKNGITDLEALKAVVDDEVAAVLVQYPNFFGVIEPLAEISAITHRAAKALLVTSSNPLALGLLEPPGSFGSDIVTGDVQPFGIPASYGGPHCGYFATTKKWMRKIPGRLVGQTIDEEGRRGFVLTLQAREQHIRRDKATSNICSNQALNALASAVAMSALGKTGVKEMANQNLQKAHYAQRKLEEYGIPLSFPDAPFFNEFAIQLRRPTAQVNQYLLEQGILGGYDLGNVERALDHHMLVAVTEMRTKEEIDRFAKLVGGSQ